MLEFFLLLTIHNQFSVSTKSHQRKTSHLSIIDAVEHHTTQALNNTVRTDFSRYTIYKIREDEAMAQKNIIESWV